MSIERRHLGKYKLLQRLAHGGMGDVWKALDTQLQRPVAIKLLLPYRQNDPEFVARFEREAQLIASLHHPNIVQIHNFHISDPPESDPPLAYMVMDYVQGQTLADYIRATSRKGIFPSASDVVYIFTGISLALDYAHQRGMIHRDIKPANVLLDQRSATARAMGEPVLTDFGIARQLGVPSGTPIDAMIGTPLYMAPEQARGQYDDRRSDIYSLGIILYEMMTGVVPFRGETSIAILMQHFYDVPIPPHLINREIPLSLSEVILTCIAKNPEQRFASASALAIALAQSLAVPVSLNLLEKPQTSVSSLLLDTLSTTLQKHVSVPLLPQSPYFPSAKPLKNVNVSSSDLQARQSDTLVRVSATPAEAIAQLPQKRIKSGHLKKRWQVLIAILLIVALIATLWKAFLPFPSQESRGPVIGQVRFLHDRALNNDNYNAIQLDIKHIPDPPPGFKYYAWIYSDAVVDPPSWKLQIEQGAIHMSGLTYADVNDLYQPGDLFLISMEQDGALPEGLNVDSTLLYYAQITETPDPVFAMRACSVPASGGMDSPCAIKSYSASTSGGVWRYLPQSSHL